MGPKEEEKEEPKKKLKPTSPKPKEEEKEEPKITLKPKSSKPKEEEKEEPKKTLKPKSPKLKEKNETNDETIKIVHSNEPELEQSLASQTEESSGKKTGISHLTELEKNCN